MAYSLPEYFDPFTSKNTDTYSTVLLFDVKKQELQQFLQLDIATLPIITLYKETTIKTFIERVGSGRNHPYFGLLVYKDPNTLQYDLGWLGSSISSYPHKTWAGDYTFKLFSEFVEVYYNAQ